MLHGLGRLDGVAGALMLNLEAPFTILVAVLIFREHLGRQAQLAAVFIIAGALALGAVFFCGYALGAANAHSERDENELRRLYLQLDCKDHHL